ncbi:hypothetical protein [Promicromonospora iranensis]|uniref:Nudix hydrolase domain-containing protein n=1 Tax=Promicromonospora iranensis TaxID=1105144 RepID=A0ABU2CH11_9MICO|nr:hypothetical protein [Promicromonospora iranensis]MDR7380601.1 hypothetical protein [Promicromonospora iranensis]
MIRSAIDRVRFLMKAEWVYVTGLAGFALGLVPSLLKIPSWLNGGLLVLATVTALALIVRDSALLRMRWSQWVMAPRSLPLSFEGSPAVPGLPSVLLSAEGRMAFDPELDLKLAHALVPVQMAPSMYTLPTGLADVAPYVMSNSARGHWPFNGPNVRLCTDIDQDFLEQDRPAVVQRSNFFSLLCSNELTRWDIEAPEGPFRFRENYLFDDSGDFRRFDSSKLDNSIGVSTLAITTDDHLVVTLQTTRSQASSGRLAPSGSGALEPRDYSDSSFLHELICRGAERELREETTISRTAIGRSAVVGYGRWLDRGAKPEFFCVTALTVSSQELRRKGLIHGVLTDERLWTQTIRVTPLNLSAIQNLPADTELSAEQAPCWHAAGLLDLSRQIGEPSVPLDSALDALVRVLRADPSFLVELRDEGAARAKPAGA